MNIPDKQTREDWRRQSHYEPWLCQALDAIDTYEDALEAISESPDVCVLWLKEHNIEIDNYCDYREQVSNAALRSA